MCQNVTKQISSLNIIIIIYFIILIVIIVMVPSNPLFGMFVRLHVFPFHWAVWLLPSVEIRFTWGPCHVISMALGTQAHLWNVENDLKSSKIIIFTTDISSF